MVFSAHHRRPPSPDGALPGRSHPAHGVPETHAVLGTPLGGPWPEGTAVMHVAMGCFWGAEKAFWQLPGVVTTAVGYAGGTTPNPTYEEVCTGRTGHAETVLIAYDPAVLTHDEVIRTFWQEHDPTQGFRQGNDVGTQYRSALYWTQEAQRAAIEASEPLFAERLEQAGYGPITTEVAPLDRAGPFYYAEGYHQQYLAKNPAGYCPIHATGVACPLPG